VRSYAGAWERGNKAGMTICCGRVARVPPILWFTKRLKIKTEKRGDQHSQEEGEEEGDVFLKHLEEPAFDNSYSPFPSKGT